VTPWITIAAIGVGSYVFRISMLVLAARAGLPPVVERAARFAVPVCFAALAAAALADHIETADQAAVPAISVIVAIVAVRRTGSANAALVAGMPAFWLLSALCA
jgi:branched-subunit amino acid transport protein